MKTIVYADKFFLNSGVVGPGYLDISDGIFGELSIEKPEDIFELIDLKGKWVAPGLVDTHIHGFKNNDVMDNNAAGLKQMSLDLLTCGVTSFLPTTLTSTIKQLTAVAKTIGEVADKVKGAKIQGIYFEGPFFTEEHKGAQNPNYFLNPNISIFNEWQEASGNRIKKIALAPEREGANEFIKEVTDQGVVVALGHSNGTLVETRNAIESGASVFVHVFNGMRGLNHREPGMVGAAMSLNNVYSELICDGHHVNPIAANILMEKVGRDHVALITDCMMAGGMPDGEYMLGEFPVIVKEGTARLKEGNLAGSILRLNEAIKNVVEWGIATPQEAIRMASYVPAVSCNIEDVCGSIQIGRAADFIVLSESLDLEATYLNGICKYKVK